MLAIASALIGRPSYLIIDELSLGLAPVIVRRLGPVVRQIAETGVGILLIVHRLAEPQTNETD